MAKMERFMNRYSAGSVCGMSALQEYVNVIRESVCSTSMVNTDINSVPPFTCRIRVEICHKKYEYSSGYQSSKKQATASASEGLIRELLKSPPPVSVPRQAPPLADMKWEPPEAPDEGSRSKRGPRELLFKDSHSIQDVSTAVDSLDNYNNIFGLPEPPSYERPPSYQPPPSYEPRYKQVGPSQAGRGKLPVRGDDAIWLPQFSAAEMPPFEAERHLGQILAQLNVACFTRYKKPPEQVISFNFRDNVVGTSTLYWCTVESILQTKLMIGDTSDPKPKKKEAKLDAIVRSEGLLEELGLLTDESRELIHMARNST